MNFTQFLMPDGRRKLVTVARSAEIEVEAARLEGLGVRFEIEVLTTSEISMTAEIDTDNEDENPVLAMEIVENGPPVLDAVDRLVRAASTYMSARGPSHA